MTQYTPWKRLISDVFRKYRASFWYLYWQLGTYFPPFSGVSIVNFDHVIAGRVHTLLYINTFLFKSAFAQQF